jgi:hypothetical protein
VSTKASATDADDVSSPRTSRRGVLAVPFAAAATVASTDLAAPQRAHAEDTRVFAVSGSGASGASGAPGTRTETFGSINAALAKLAASPDSSPAVIQLSAGTYAERVVIPAGIGDVTLEPAPGVPPRSVIVEHRTEKPYEATIETSPTGASSGTSKVVVRGVVVKHASPSVANNYAVFAVATSDLTLVDCSVSSETGSGVACEGATLVVRDCEIVGCKAHGVAAYGDAYGEFGTVVVVGCSVTDNGLDGILLRQGVLGTIIGNAITNNARYAVEMVDCGEGTALKNNTWSGSGMKKNPLKFTFAGSHDARDVVVENNNATTTTTTTTTRLKL